MTPNELRTVMHADPFVPFRIHMAGGKSLRVPHRDFMVLSPTGRIAMVFNEEDDAFFRVDTLLVTALEEDAMDTSEVPPPPAAGD